MISNARYIPSDANLSDGGTRTDDDPKVFTQMKNVIRDAGFNYTVLDDEVLFSKRVYDTVHLINSLVMNRQ